MTASRTPTRVTAAAATDAAAPRPLLVLLTDGRATAGPDPVEAATAVRRRGVAAVVVDVEGGHTRLGLARSIALAMDARYLTLPELTGAALHDAVRRAVG